MVGPGSTVQSVSGSGQILWWSDGVDGIMKTGSGSVSLPYASNMFAPNSTGSGDGGDFETAALWGDLHGTGADVKITVSSDDDTLVYVNGMFVGGNLGVHGTEDDDNRPRRPLGLGLSERLLRRSRTDGR